MKRKELTTEQVIENKLILDMNDSEKIRKDVMLKNCDELTKHLSFLNDRIGEATKEYETRRRLVDSVNGSIAGAQTELQNIRSTIEKKHAEAFKEIEKQKTELASADKTVQNLVQENREAKKANEIEASKLAEHRRICDAQVYEMQKALDQNNAQWNKREADILKREAELKVEREAFEAEKEALLPEAAKITATKNENIMLLQKIEMDRRDIENLHKSTESEKERNQEILVIGQSRIKQYEDKLANEEARLRTWEQNLNDQALELKAKTVRADKILIREQYQKEVDSNK